MTHGLCPRRRANAFGYSGRSVGGGARDLIGPRKTKLPFAIQLRGDRPFWFAGIYEAATDSRPAAYALLTTTPNDLVAPIHNRMPVILSDAAATRWLTPGAVTAEDLAEFVQPFPAELMECYAVSRLVNNPRNDIPEVDIATVADVAAGEGGGPNSAWGRRLERATLPPHP